MYNTKYFLVACVAMLCVSALGADDAVPHVARWDGIMDLTEYQKSINYTVSEKTWGLNCTYISHHPGGGEHIETAFVPDGRDPGYTPPSDWRCERVLGTMEILNCVDHGNPTELCTDDGQVNEMEVECAFDGLHNCDSLILAMNYINGENIGELEEICALVQE